MKLPEITPAHIKDWFRRHGRDIGLPDEIIEEVARRGNAHSQELEDQRERDRLKHLKPAASQDQDPDKTPVFAIRCPAPTKDDLIKSDRRIAASLVDIPGAFCK